jgi:hypothetical protein
MGGRPKAFGPGTITMVISEDGFIIYAAHQQLQHVVAASLKIESKYVYWLLYLDLSGLKFDPRKSASMNDKTGSRS